MLVAERRKEIVKLIEEHQTVKVSELGKRFNVTEETIRRDLESLEVEGKLLRTHGGAMKIADSQWDLPHSHREILNKKEKMAIAKRAITHIHERDIIFLDASSTTQYVAKFLPNMPLTVLTNSLQVCHELASHNQIRIISTGGEFMESSMSFVGPLTLQTLEKYHVNKAFFSCKGIDANWGISDSNELQALVKNKVIGQAEKKYLLLDHTKMEKKTFAPIGKISDITTLITDTLSNDHILDVYGQAGIEIVKAKV